MIRAQPTRAVGAGRSAREWAGATPRLLPCGWGDG